jgi:hypothetical protein
MPESFVGGSANIKPNLPTKQAPTHLRAQAATQSKAVAVLDCGQCSVRNAASTAVQASPAKIEWPASLHWMEAGHGCGW